MKMNISTVFGLVLIVAMLALPLVSFVGANGIASTVRGKPGGGGTTGGVGTAGPASKAGADGIVKKYALCVGVSNYIDSRIGDLSYCDEDAADWKSYLQGKGYSTSSLVDSQAKEPAVEAALFSIIAAADADDQIVFATSGHGTSGSGSQLLLYADCYANPTDGDGFYGGIVPDKELANWFAKCTSKVLIITDHCNSGGLTEAIHTGMILQATCGASGYGYDVPDYNNGAFTYWYVHKALAQGYNNAEAAFAYVDANYPYGGKDSPVMKDSLTGNFVF
jgi:uncharacterized caspase-like protein